MHKMNQQNGLSVQPMNIDRQIDLDRYDVSAAKAVAPVEYDALIHCIIMHLLDRLFRWLNAKPIK